MQRTQVSAALLGDRISRIHVRSTSFAVVVVGILTAGMSFAAPTTETVIWNFVGGNGGYPDGPLVLGPDSGLYGTTVSGGAYNEGTIFELIAPATTGGAWTEKLLYSFTGGLDGAQPAAAVAFDGAGALYGTAENAAGTANGVAFKLSPPITAGGPWYESTIYSFTGTPDGADPNSGLVVDHSGNLFGTTTGGGTSGLGTVFKLFAPAGGTGVYTEQILHSFTGGADGATPYANIAFSNASGSEVLFGTTTAGGTGSSGTVFMMQATGSSPAYKTIYSFSGGADGATPYAPVTVGPTGNLFGTTFFGGESVSGTGSFGVIYELTPPTGSATAYTQTVLHTFNGADGANPSGGLVTDTAGGLYGTTAGGVVGFGNVFELSYSSKTYNLSVLYTFPGTGGDGQAPLGSVLLTAGGVLYGTTYYGGAFGPGTAFQLK